MHLLSISESYLDICNTGNYFTHTHTHIHIDIIDTVNDQDSHSIHSNIIVFTGFTASLFQRYIILLIFFLFIILYITEESFVP